MKHPELMKWRLEYIESMKELIKRYQLAIKNKCSKTSFENQTNLSCLLCKPLGITKDELAEAKENCYNWDSKCRAQGCPWMVITGKNCDATSIQEFDDEGNVYDKSIYQTESPKRMNNRIRQIRHHIKKYENFK